MIGSSSANSGQDNDCGITCVLSDFFDSVFGTGSGYDYYGGNETGNGSDYYDYYYYNTGPNMQEEIIIIPLSPSGSGPTFGDYNYSSYNAPSSEGNMSQSGWTGIGIPGLFPSSSSNGSVIPFPPFSVPATNTSSKSGSSSSSSSSGSNSGSTWGSGSSSTWSGSGSGTSSSGAATSTSAPAPNITTSGTSASGITLPSTSTSVSASSAPSTSAPASSSPSAPTNTTSVPTNATSSASAPSAPIPINTNNGIFGTQPTA
ncbi:secreted protein C-like [Planococcus citri]|uniref:secreted protein C-like n=1 Tax=Planococcus citri TaxID=170843 RepID=UPI0031F80782